MKEESREKLQDAIGMIDEELLKVSAPASEQPAALRKPRRRARLIGGLSAAAAALMAAAAILLASAGTDSSEKYIVKYIEPETTCADLAETVNEDTWNNMTNVERYRELSYQDTVYSFCLIAVQPENLGEYLGTAVARGQDSYTQELHELEVQVYAIKGIDPGYAITASLEPDSEYTHAFINTRAYPTTLEELNTALSLSEFLTVGNAYYTDKDGQEVVYENISAAEVLELLNRYATSENARELTGDFILKKVISVSTNIRILNIENKAITLTSDGYLWTNLLEYANYFYIGEDAVNAFVSYVTENYQGCIYVYDYEGEPVPEIGVTAPEFGVETLAETTSDPSR